MKSKKLLALVISVLMVISALPVSVGAVTQLTDDQTAPNGTGYVPMTFGSSAIHKANVRTNPDWGYSVVGDDGSITISYAGYYANFNKALTYYKAFYKYITGYDYAGLSGSATANYAPRFVADASAPKGWKVYNTGSNVITDPNGVKFTKYSDYGNGSFVKLIQDYFLNLDTDACTVDGVIDGSLMVPGGSVGHNQQVPGSNRGNSTYMTKIFFKAQKTVTTSHRFLRVVYDVKLPAADVEAGKTLLLRMQSDDGSVIQNIASLTKDTNGYVLSDTIEIPETNTKLLDRFAGNNHTSLFLETKTEDANAYVKIKGIYFFNNKENADAFTMEVPDGNDFIEVYFGTNPHQHGTAGQLPGTAATYDKWNVVYAKPDNDASSGTACRVEGEDLVLRYMYDTTDSSGDALSIAQKGASRYYARIRATAFTNAMLDYKYARVLYSASGIGDGKTTTLKMGQAGQFKDTICTVNDTNGNFVLTDPINVANSIAKTDGTARLDEETCIGFIETANTNCEFKIRGIYLFKSVEDANAFTPVSEYNTNDRIDWIFGKSTVIPEDTAAPEVEGLTAVQHPKFFVPSTTGKGADCYAQVAKDPYTDPDGVKATRIEDDGLKLDYLNYEYYTAADGPWVSAGNDAWTALAPQVRYKARIIKVGTYDKSYKYARVVYSADGLNTVTTNLSWHLFGNVNGNHVIPNIHDTDGEFELSGIVALDTLYDTTKKLSYADRIYSNGESTLAFTTSATGFTFNIRRIMFFRDLDDAVNAEIPEEPVHVTDPTDYIEGRFDGAATTEKSDLIEIDSRRAVNDSYQKILKNPENISEGYATRVQGGSLVLDYMCTIAENRGETADISGLSGENESITVGGMAIGRLFQKDISRYYARIMRSSGSTAYTNDYPIVRVVYSAEGLTGPTQLKTGYAGQANYVIDDNITNTDGFVLSAPFDLSYAFSDAGSMADRYASNDIGLYFTTTAEGASFKINRLLFFRYMDDAEAYTLPTVTGDDYFAMTFGAEGSVNRNTRVYIGSADTDDVVASSPVLNGNYYTVSGAPNRTKNGTAYAFKTFLEGDAKTNFNTDYRFVRMLYRVNAPSTGAVNFNLLNGPGSEIALLDKVAGSTDGFILSGTAQLNAPDGTSNPIIDRIKTNNSYFFQIATSTEGYEVSLKAVYFFKDAAEAAFFTVPEFTEFTGAQPTLNDKIDLTYFANVTEADRARGDITMSFQLKNVEGAVPEVVNGVLDGNEYKFNVGVLPQNMNQTIVATLKAGDELLGVKEYSITEYVKNKIAKGATGTLKTLLLDMLAYGAEAQKVALGAEYGTLPTEGVDMTDASASQVENAVDATVFDASANNSSAYKWTAVTLVLKDKVNIRYKFYTENATGLKVSVNGVELTPVADTAKGEGYYYVDFDQIDPAMYDDAFTATFVVDSSAQANTLTYSVGSYVARKYASATTEKALIEKLYNYGCSAKAYIG